MFGSSKLIAQQVKDVYWVKESLLKVYRKEVWDLIDNFFLAFNITYIPRDHNQTTDSLALARTNFLKCRKYGLSLNRKESHSSMEDGKTLGNIVSTKGIKINPKQVKSILKIILPINKKKEFNISLEI